MISDDISDYGIELWIDLSNLSNVWSGNHNVSFNVVGYNGLWGCDICIDYAQIDYLRLISIHFVDHYNSLGFSLALVNESYFLYYLEVFEDCFSRDLAF